eukprot:gnl/TRDRNA2_/TRDRNA2_30766_c0_seq1.p1 gnl/TRDRNA2_/TRDRNA2_30766_c0~~gnl/TRDRNA2_/TRDRNA2_30766_c0_seq1.p1  ORF type:complete len:475 (-),score=49.90 gnl/TRDRNA2_/TRDRNA2_30766_c0_seq1:49-1473(-)
MTQGPTDAAAWRVKCLGLRAWLWSREPDGGQGVLYPRFVWGTIVIVYCAVFSVWLERQVRLSAKESYAHYRLRDFILPNYHHVSNERDLLFEKKGRADKLSQFGRHFANLQAKGKNKTNVWRDLCKLDSDNDGRTNGEELGDPCCRWKSAPPHSLFALDNHLEYRRWGLTNPSVKDDPATLRVRPKHCDHYEQEDYDNVYSDFYYLHIRLPTRNYKAIPEVKHWVGIAFLSGLMGSWLISKGLFMDMFPMLFARPHLSVRTSLLTNLAAFLFMDLTSGVVHLMLDYMPNWLPFVGIVANGFQEHHSNPGLLARKPIWNQVNDVFMIAPLAVIFLLATGPSRLQRLFWFWGVVYAFLFLMAHPWAHKPKDMLPWPVQVAQAWGILLDQDKHMRHHADLESQFTILSGHADLVIDNLSQLVPPQRYDLWLIFFVTWFLSPIFLDVRCRKLMESVELTANKEKVADIRGDTVKVAAV